MTTLGVDANRKTELVVKERVYEKPSACRYWKNNENHVDGMWITIFEKAPYQGLVCEDDVLGFFFAAEPESSLESDCVDWAF